MPSVPEEAREVARQMAANPDNYNEFHNRHPRILPKILDTEHYIEADVEMGHAEGRGQYRVVCLVDGHNHVRKKYWSATHYGTGEDASRLPAFVEFR